MEKMNSIIEKMDDLIKNTNKMIEKESSPPRYIEIKGGNKSYIAFPNGDNTFVLANAKELNGKLVPDTDADVKVVTKEILNDVRKIAEVERQIAKENIKEERT